MSPAKAASPGVVDLATHRLRRGLRELVQQHPELTTPDKQARLASWLAAQDEEKPMTKDSLHNRNLNIRVTPEDIDRLDRLSERIMIGDRSSIARAAMRLGIDLLEEDPARIVAKPKPGKNR